MDIGGGAGVYAFPLAEAGYQVYLGDLSERLIEQAREQRTAENVENMMSIDVVNATDMSQYEDGFFDVVIALGPFYHLTESTERSLCIGDLQSFEAGWNGDSRIYPKIGGKYRCSGPVLLGF